MKKLFTISFAMLLGGLLQASSPNNPQPPSFNDDLHCLNAELQNLSALEQLLEQHNVTYTQLALEENNLLQYLNNDHQDISSSLLASVAPMDPALKAVLIVFGILALLAIGCCVVYVVLWNSIWWGW